MSDKRKGSREVHEQGGQARIEVELTEEVEVDEADYWSPYEAHHKRRAKGAGQRPAAP